ncbi:MAG: hypothetical protein I3273_03250 [Candidatus Moeniiplasma glomeromycotorum]|nr:hypothetical protein [Candidatus Moeniiplasma glomeromycotorum]MCE8167718.1 hypothetical protein [Candidatus Moeniiplasma glomeromycotorum]MCE8169118.1 hypothetical protein [Candidatus Moeniiplasma glomeromycotorum]
MSTIFEETKHCKYCNNKLKEIVYEIIEPDKSGYFNRYFCDKCVRMFHFREPREKTPKLKKNIKKRKSKKEK